MGSYIYSCSLFCNFWEEKAFKWEKRFWNLIWRYVIVVVWDLSLPFCWSGYVLLEIFSVEAFIFICNLASRYLPTLSSQFLPFPFLISSGPLYTHRQTHTGSYSNVGSRDLGTYVHVCRVTHKYRCHAHPHFPYTCTHMCTPTSITYAHTPACAFWAQLRGVIFCVSGYNSPS